MSIGNTADAARQEPLKTLQDLNLSSSAGFQRYLMDLDAVLAGSC
jgi:hypothetical protein